MEAFVGCRGFGLKKSCCQIKYLVRYLYYYIRNPVVVCVFFLSILAMTRCLYLIIPMVLEQAGGVDWEAAGRIRDYVFSIDTRSERIGQSNCALKTISTIDNRMRVVRRILL